MTTLPIVRPIFPYVMTALCRGLICAGGYPLWLVGGASFYSDIDVYALDWMAFYREHGYLRESGKITKRTPEATEFVLDGQRVQLVKPCVYQRNAVEIMVTSDLSPSACALVLEDGQPVVKALYPDDIRNRVCRVLVEHDWTAYRTEVYIEKGYTIIR